MANRRAQPPPRIDGDGIKTTDDGGVRSGVWLLALALLIVGMAIIVITRPAVEHLQTVAVDSAPSGAASNAAVSHRGPIARPAPPQAAGDKQPPPSREPPGPPAPHVPAVAAAPDTAADAAAADQPSGIAVFPPQGTKPILRGIIVPDGVELPSGYVRHYQSTFEGRQLPPILMFHPDYHPLDEHGDPIALPEDRVVPADMAPAGMPIQMLDVPEDGAPMPGISARAPSQPNP